MSDKKNSASKASVSLPVAIIIAGLFIGVGLYFGLKGQQGKNAMDDTAAPALKEQAAKPQEQFPATTTSIDDDAVLGNKDNAQVAIVEFSDYECPFCTKFRNETFDQIKSEYIDSGKAILVYRDLALPMHNPVAEQEAMAAECAGELGGDEAYYQYHDELFNRSEGNGKGLAEGGLSKIAADLGLNVTQFDSCLEAEKYKDEVAKDAADAAKAGIQGTPGFVVGKLNSDGTVEGKAIKGAYPFEAFEEIIESYL